MVNLLAASAELLSARGVFGCIWTDDRLIARRSYGRLADLVTIGNNVCDDILPLLGLDDQLSALRRRPDRVFQIPNVAIMTADGTAPRLNITVFWMPHTQGYLVLVSRALARDDLEIELTQQTRRRMLTEAQLVEQSMAIKAANEELSRANRDLTEFTAIVSHDLKAPMRALRYTTEDLERALTDPDGGDPQAHIDKLHRQSRRMSGMLTSLLAYVRLDRNEDARETVDTRTLIDDVAASLPVPNGFAITVSGRWPVLTTLREPLDLTLRNLLDNALKHHDRQHGRVLVAAEPAQGGLAISVEDDGPGIPADLHDAVFRPFTRLGEDNANDGLGMGLALVQRAVQRAGGTLVLISAPDKARGTRFKLWWPGLV